MLELPTQRSLLLSSLVVASLWLVLLHPWQGHAHPIPRPEVHAVLHNPYRGSPLLGDYRRVYDALQGGDLATLEPFLQQESFLAYRTLLTLARDERLSPLQRARYYERVFTLGLVEPLAREDLRRAHLEYARVAERAGLTQKARDAFVEALPLPEAVAGLERLEPRPRALARLFLEAREYELALDALGTLRAPAVEAPAYRGLGEMARALEAYDRWLARAPGSLEALEGKAWTLLALERPREASALFAALPGNRGLSGRAALAEQREDFGEAARLYRERGDLEGLWSATEMLEAAGREADALPLYLTLARQASDYADDAAYRALVLAERLGDEGAAAEADALLPTLSYFSLVQGSSLDVPDTSALPRVTPPALALSDALLGARDREAALGELLLALRNADDEATTVALAEALQGLGEFRHSQSAAAAWVRSGSRDARTWRAAYPRAYRSWVRFQGEAWRVEPELIWSVMRQESAFYPRAVSVSEARGLMQIVPSTWSWLAELLREAPADPFRIEENIRYGTFYLRHLLDMFGGDLERAVSSYNGGPGYIQQVYESTRVEGDRDEFYRFIDRAETREYLQKVMLNYAIYKALY